MTKEGRGPASFHMLLLVAASLLITIFVIAGARTFRDLTAVKSRETRVKKRIEETDRRIEEIEGRIEDLETDPATLERLAREELGLVKPGEVVILLPPESTVNSTASDSSAASSTSVDTPDGLGPVEDPPPSEP